MIEENHFRNLTRADLRLVLEVSSELHCAEPEHSFVRHCHLVLSDAFGQVHLTSEHFQVDPFRPIEQVAPTIEGNWFPFAMEHIPEHPYYPRMPSKLEPEISATQLEPVFKDFLKTPLYNEFYAEIGGPNQMWIGLRNQNDLLINMLYRDRPYGEKEVAMLHMVQPHLEAAWKNWKRSRSFRQELDLLRGSIFKTEEEEAEANRLRKALDALTPRQRDVVELVAAGSDNQQIADELRISVWTVKKHMQTIFQALGIHHRTELSARWHQAYSARLP